MIVEIKSGEEEASIVSEGAYLNSYKFKGKDVVLQGKERKTRGGMALLIPFANRVNKGEYVWNGKLYRLPLNREGNSIHGLILDRDFSVESSHDRGVALYTELNHVGYPTTLGIRIEYEVGGGLTCKIVIKNVGEQDAPLVIGAHPYFIVTEDWKIIPNKAKKCLTRGKIPTGEMVNTEIINTDYDDCFFLPGEILLSSQYSKIAISKPGMDFVQIYTGVPGALAIEPMSGAPDAFNNGIGLIKLLPSQTKEFSFQVKVLQI
ncbi:MAG: aldose 1-epimerase [Metallosphaera sp.]|uniref:aldose 1-epimerase n=1 Tax=Metallosphaera sp. TaxID=2020860 RepID=UPI003161B431